MIVEVNTDWTLIELGASDYMFVSHKDTRDMHFSLGSAVPAEGDYHDWEVKEKIGGITTDIQVRRDPFSVPAASENTKVIVSLV